MRGNPATQQSYSIEEFDKMFPDTGSVAMPTVPAAQANQQGDNPYGAWFPATGKETPIEAGFKAAGNVLPSAYNFGSGILSAVTSPIDTGKGVLNALTGFGGKIQNKLSAGVDKVFGTENFGRFDNQQAEATADALINVYKDRYGSVENAQKTAINDPFGVGVDVLSVVSGGASVTGQSARLNNAISKTGQLVTRPISGLSKSIANRVSGTARFATSQATGLSPETVSTITSNPKAVTAAQNAGTSRVDLADDVLTAVRKAQDDISDLGNVYDDIRNSGATTKLPDNWLKSSLDEYGLTLKDGKVSASRSSRTRNTTDLNKIQEFVDNWGDARLLTADEYLNMRHDLAELAKYDTSGKSTVARQFGQHVREGVLNADDVRSQVPGLKELDSKFSADKTFLRKLERDFIDPKTGGLKDGAASKVVNSINSANPERLARLEQLYPGFTDQAKVIKAVEDIEAAYGLKVGAYIRAGAATGGLITGNVPVIVGAILSSPEIAVPLLKGYGYTAETIKPILRLLREAGSDINNFRVPGGIQSYLEEKYPDGIPAGASIQTNEGKALRTIQYIDEKGVSRTIRLEPDAVKGFTDSLKRKGIPYTQA